MNTIWPRIETWLASNAPGVRAALSPPATRAQITQAESVLRISFPPDLAETFLIQNAQNPNSPGLLDGWEFMSLTHRREWKIWKELLDAGDFADSRSDSDGHTVTDWWHPHWIPLTSDGGGNHHCLDLNPGPQGKLGQIIVMWHDYATREVIAPSYREWLSKFASDLEADNYERSDEYGGTIQKDA